MDFLIVLASLCFLMFVAYRGYSVILFAPIAALGAVFFTDPGLVAPMFTGLFMPKMVVFIQNYFPVFLLGALFGKVIELSGFSKSIVAAVIDFVGRERAILSIVVVCALLTYFGVSLFVVVFAVYPFASELFRQSDIPKRLIPGTIALGSFTFTMDALPGTPQIQNIIPTTFFKTNIYAAPILGTIGAVFILIFGMLYLESRRRAAAKAGEGYVMKGVELVNEPAPFEHEKLANPFIAILPLVSVGVMNYVFTKMIPMFYGTKFAFTPSAVGKPAAAIEQSIGSVGALWAVEGALLVGISLVFVFAGRTVMGKFMEGSKSAIAGAHRRAARVHRCCQGLVSDSQSIGQRGDHRHCAGRYYRFGIGWHGYRAGGNGRYFYPERTSGRYSARSVPPCRLNGFRRYGYTAA